MADASISIVKDPPASSSSSSSAPAYQIKNVRFTLGKGNKSDGKLIVVPKHAITDPPGVEHSGTLRIKDKQKVPHFIKNVLLSEEFLGIVPPKVLISVTGAATLFNLDPKLEQIFCKGLVNAAKSTTAWIVSGGTDVGVMHFVGEANRRFETDVPTIGFATYNKINNGRKFKGPDKIIDYDATGRPEKDTVNLNANHSHFVLIESHLNNWGEEIEARSDFEEYMCTEYQMPGCLIVVNGGPGTLRTVAEGAMRKFSVVIFEGTGRAADAIAREIRRKRNLPYEGLLPMKLDEKQMADMNNIVENCDHVTLYSEHQGPFDLEVLKAILSSAHGSLLKKLELAVEWDRADLALHLLEAASKDISPEELARTLSKATEIALDLEKPALFRLFAEKGAKKNDIDLKVLYTEVEHTKGLVVDPLIRRYSPHLGASRKDAMDKLSRNKSKTVKVLSPDTPLLDSPQIVHPSNSNDVLSHTEISFIKGIFSAVDPVFQTYAKTLKAKLTGSSRKGKLGSQSEYGSVSKRYIPLQPLKEGEDEDVLEENKLAKVTFTDTLLWAILAGKLELAKVIWEQTSLPIHSAIIASGLCKGVAKWLLNEAESFLETAAWFEDVAVKLLEKLEYEDAKTLLEFFWPEFGSNALELAVRTECKDFCSDRHVQRYLDGLLYADEHGGIAPGTSMFKVILCIFLPFLLHITKTYDSMNTQSGELNEYGKWYYFYALPYTKFWTSTLCYIGYLSLLAVVLVVYQVGTDISPAEIMLWIWMFGYSIEEISQLRLEGWSYFRYNSNKMDIFILILQIVYISLAIGAYKSENPVIQQASSDFLIVAAIISYVRLMDVFSISKELGPLYVVLQKIIGDVFRWIFVFLLFGIGFQVSFMALNQQAINLQQSTDSDIASSSEIPDPTIPTIDGGTFMGAFFTIIGDWDSSMQVLKEAGWFGALVVSVYALIAQIMLVNLLIAMMGDTFNSVKENSDKEWRFSRYDLIVEYTSASFHPPPFNILVLPIKSLIRMLSNKGDVRTDEYPLDKLSKKQRSQFKNLMKFSKESYLQDSEEEEKKTIGSVSDMVRDSFKTLIDEQELKHSSISAKIADLSVKTQAISVAANVGGAANNELKMEINFVGETVNNLVKQEISSLQKSLLDAIKSATQQQDSTIFHIQNNDIPITWTSNVSRESVQKFLNEYKPFKEWVEKMNQPHNIVNAHLQSIHIQAIDLFGTRVGFAKFHAVTVTPAGLPIAGLVFMRGSSVGILVVLKLNDPGAPDHGKEYTTVTYQPRIPVGESRFAEIPAGMLDDGQFAGVAAKELEEETGIVIKEEELIDLTGLAYSETPFPGIYPSAGGCDESIRLFLYRTTVTREQLNSYHNKTTGLIGHNEVINLQVLPLDELWTKIPDAKALCALYLYHALTTKGVIPADY